MSTPATPVFKSKTWNGFESGLPEKWSYTSPWRQTVQRRRTMLFDDLARLELKEPTEQEERAYLINSLLSDAGIASEAKVGIRKWWWGTEIERAWARLREVEERTVDLLPDEELPARAAEALGHAAVYLKGDDKRRQHLEALRANSSNTAAKTLRSSIVDVLRASHASADQRNQEARFLRNRLILGSVVILLFEGLIVFAQSWWRDTPFLALPSDWHGSAWSYLLVVMLFGAVGALFTAIPAMSKVPSDNSPFNLPLQQALLKIVLGPLVAVIGLLIVDTSVLQVGISKNWAGTVFLAVIFGAGQQAVTRYVDQRASEILTAASGSATK
jgi:hypothetical protein